MRHFIDFEFLEGDIPVKFLGCNIPKWLIKPNNTIQPISVGLVSSDGREYYAISKDFNLKEAWNRYDLKKEYPDDTEEGAVSRKVYWIRENVLRPIFEELWDRFWRESGYLGIVDMKFTYDSLKYLIEKYGKTNKQIAFEILNFVHGYNNMGNWLGTTDEYYNTLKNSEPKEPPKFYAYFADYDWVAFCWLFGKMIDLPNGFSKYCIDLKQMLDEQAVLVPYSYTVELGLTSLKLDPRYPKQTNEHNALSDAHFNYNLYKFLQTI